MERKHLIVLEETKDMIGKKLQEDERRIKVRNPKKQMVSEEKWSEGTSWMEIIQEGEKREKEVELEEEGKSQPRILNVDKALLLMIPGTDPIAPTIKPNHQKDISGDILDLEMVGKYSQYYSKQQQRYLS